MKTDESVQKNEGKSIKIALKISPERWGKTAPKVCSMQFCDWRRACKQKSLALPLLRSTFGEGTFVMCSAKARLTVRPRNIAHSRHILGYGLTAYEMAVLENSTNSQGALKGTEEPKTQIFAENRRFLQIHPFSGKFKHSIGGRGKPQKTADFCRKTKNFAETAGNCRLGSVTLGPSP